MSSNRIELANAIRALTMDAVQAATSHSASVARRRPAQWHQAWASCRVTCITACPGGARCRLLDVFLEARQRISSETSSKELCMATECKGEIGELGQWRKIQ